MNIYARLGIVAVLLVVIGITLAMKHKDKPVAGNDDITSAEPLRTSPDQPGDGAANPPNSGKSGSAADSPREDGPAAGQPGTVDAVANETRSATPDAAATAPDRISAARADSPAPKAEGPQKKLPRLVDLGAGKCIPCKQMAPILENLKKEYAGRMVVEFIDVWENPKAGEQYGVRMIPTQIFYDASGKERFRHEGFYSKENILGKWKELGVDVESKPAAN